MSTKSPKVAPQPLDVFMADKQRAACAVCKLPPEIQAQLGPPATKRGFTRPDQLEWLHKAVGATTITAEALTRHLNGNHFRQQGEA